MAQNPSVEYWSKRAESRMRTYEQQTKLTERILKKAYQNTQRNIDAEIRQLYRNYRRQYGLSAKEAEAFLAQPVDRETYLRLLQEIKGVSDPETLRLLEARAGSGAYGFRIQRQEALKLHVDAQMAKLAETEIGTDTRFFQDLIPEAYNRTIFDIQRGTGLGFTFGQMDTASIRRILTNPWSGQHFSTRIWNNTSALARLLNEEIPAAFADGRSVQKVSRDIANRMGIGYRESERLVRTEMSYMANAGTMAGYTESGLEKYRFLATLDSVTSAICQKLDLQVFLVSRAQPGINMPPMHPNCVLPDTAVAIPNATALTKSYYSGHVVEVRTANGRSLTITPNHIMLTARGWVRAKNLIQGDKVVYYRGWDELTIEPYPAQNQGVPTIEELFTSLVKTSSVPPITMPAAAEHFKGDVAENSKISVVLIDSLLRGKCDTSALKFLSDFALIGAFKAGELALSGERTAHELLVASGLAADGIVGCGSVARVFFGGALAHHEAVCLCLAAHYDARLRQTAINNCPGDTDDFSNAATTFSRGIEGHDPINVQELACVGGTDCDVIRAQEPTNSGYTDSERVSSLLHALSAFICLDDIVGVYTDEFSGHVYDASSLSTLYIANGFVSSNCRSTTITNVSDEDLARMERWARDPVTGESRKVPGNMSYAEWRAQYVDGNTASGTAMAAQAGDNGQYERYRQVIGNERVGTFDEFQAMKRYNPESWSLMKTDYRRQHRLMEDPSLALPNAGQATAADSKFTGYLFNPQNPGGWAKGVAFDSRLGYNIDNWNALQQEILQNAGRYPTHYRGAIPYGDQYEQRMVLYGTKGTPANVVVGWMVKEGRTWMSTAMIKELKKGGS